MANLDKAGNDDTCQPSNVKELVGEIVEELKKEAVDWQTEKDGSGYRGETTYTFHLEDVEQALTQLANTIHEQIALQAESQKEPFQAFEIPEVKLHKIGCNGALSRLAKYCRDQVIINNN